MNNKLVATLFLAAIVVAAGCTTFSADSEEEEQTQQTEETPDESQGEQETGDVEAVRIEYTGNGFEPHRVTIDEGDTVRWVNTGHRDMWVATDPHPQHTGYIGTSLSEHCENDAPVDDQTFDQCSTGDEFEFTFEQTGEWYYHNHDATIHTGAVVVE